ncbi:D-glycerate dehydrogenase [Hephaestia sp. CMS5P-6]|nr:D-glycerate dehydrogenase [Hephaestia mangrovi]
MRSSVQPGPENRITLRVTRRLPEAVEARLAQHFDATFNADDTPLSRAELRQALCDFDALLPTITDTIDGELIHVEGRRARIIANYGAGVDHIDLAAAASAGVAVTNTPDALTDTTAELAILLMLMAGRRAGEGERELRAGRWTGWRPTHLVGQSLSGRTLGLIGFGRIAQRTAAMARAHGMAIRYFSRRAADPAIEAELEAIRSPSAEALVAEADIVSLHVPGGSETHHLVGEALLARMKPGAILINTARGSVVDERALAAALRSGHLAAVGLDVYEKEPAVNRDLLDHPRAVLLPHLGSATIETRNAMGFQAADNLEAFFAGRDLPNRVA